MRESDLKNCSVLLLTWHGTTMLSILRSLGPEVKRIVLLIGFPNPVIARSKHGRPYLEFPSDIGDDALVARIETVASEHGCQVLFPCDDLGVQFTVRNRTRLEQRLRLTPVSSAASLALAGNKARLTSYLSELGIDHPRSVISSAGERPAPARLQSLRLPVIAKAAQMSGGKSLYRCETPAQIAAACDRLAREGQPFLVQEWINGPDADCSILALNGRILAHTTQRSISKDPKFAPAGEIMLEEHPALVEATAKIATALNWSGLAHLDAVLDVEEGRYKVLEINPRCWGSLLASTAAGVNFPKLAVQTALGIPFSRPTLKPQRFYAGGLGLRRVLGIDSPRWRLHETDVPYFLRDPLPEWTSRRLARLSRVRE